MYYFFILFLYLYINYDLVNLKWFLVYNYIQIQDIYTDFKFNEFFNDNKINTFLFDLLLLMINSLDFIYFMTLISNTNNNFFGNINLNYYNIINFLLNHDSKNIHPIIDDFVNLENDSFFLFSNVCFIFFKIIFIFFFIELGINWSNQNVNWSYWWIWDFSEISIFIVLFFLIIQIHDDFEDLDYCFVNSNFDDDEDDFEDNFLYLIFLYLILNYFNISHSFIDYFELFYFIFFFFILILIFDEFFDIEYGLFIRKKINNLFIKIDLIFIFFFFFNVLIFNFVILLWYFFLLFFLYNIKNFFYFFNKFRLIIFHSYIYLFIFYFFKKSYILLNFSINYCYLNNFNFFYEKFYELNSTNFFNLQLWSNNLNLNNFNTNIYLYNLIFNFFKIQYALFDSSLIFFYFLIYLFMYFLWFIKKNELIV